MGMKKGRYQMQAGNNNKQNSVHGTEDDYRSDFLSRLDSVTLSSSSRYIGDGDQ